MYKLIHVAVLTFVIFLTIGILTDYPIAVVFFVSLFTACALELLADKK